MGAADDPRGTVLFLNDNWGYGSTSAAIAVAEALGNRVVTAFAGEGSAFSLANRAGFELAIDHDTMRDPEAEVLREAVSGSDMVVSIQNPHGPELAARAGVPCVYIDTLLWMWPRPPSVRGAARYFVEWFPGVKDRMQAWKASLPPSELVGPIIRAVTPGHAGNRKNVLVNFGGLSSWMIPDNALVRYARVMTECVAAALRDWPGRVTVCAGAHVLAELHKTPLRLERQDVAFADLDHQAYLDVLRHSAALVSSAGLHALYEAFEAGVPCVLLPAQNLSQTLAIPEYRSVGVPCLDWDNFYGLKGLSPAAEPEACRRIAECVARFDQEDESRSRLIHHLRATVESKELVCIREAQACFFTDPFPERGASRIGRYVAETLARRPRLQR